MPFTGYTSVFAFGAGLCFPAPQTRAQVTSFSFHRQWHTCPIRTNWVRSSKMEVGPSKESLVVICETDVNSITGSLIVIGQKSWSLTCSYVLSWGIVSDGDGSFDSTLLKRTWLFSSEVVNVTRAPRNTARYKYNMTRSLSHKTDQKWGETITNEEQRLEPRFLAPKRKRVFSQTFTG